MRPIETAYRETVRGIVEEAMLLPNDPDDGGEEGRHDFIFQSCDGSEWTIYTYHAQLAIAISENFDAYQDWGEIPNDGNGGINWSAVACAAMEADCMDYLGVLTKLANAD